MAERKLVGRVKAAVSRVGVPAVAKLARGAIYAVEAVAEAEARLEARLKKFTPAARAKAAPATPRGPVSSGAQPAPRTDRRSARPAPVPARATATTVKVKRGQKHRHHR